MTSHADLRIEAVGRSRGERLRFWRAGLAPYRADPHFVTPLFADHSSRWTESHPFFDHAETQHFIAVRDGVDVGRIAATVDRRQDETYGDSTGLFGWFETEDRRDTAHMLLDAAAAWLRERGRDRVRGPLSYTTNGISGLLVEDHRPGPPVLDMPYNPAHYAGHLTSWGLEKARDLLALWVDKPKEWSDKQQRVVRRITRRGYVLRSIRTDNAGFAEDIEHIRRIYNKAWESNWAFVPMTDDEIRHEAKSFRPILVAGLVVFAEHEGVPVGFSITMPDMNQAIAAVRGRLWPWAILKLLWAKRRVDRVRTITLGVLPEHRRAGLEIAMIMRTGDEAEPLGMPRAECSWVLEDNHLMVAAIERVGGEVYRRYRLYERTLTG